MQRPRPGDLFFATHSPSLLRDRNFLSLDQDLGVPDLLLAGGSIEDRIVPTVVDASMSGRLVSVASDTLFFRRIAEPRGKENKIWRSLLSTYARLVDNSGVYP